MHKMDEVQFYTSNKGHPKLAYKGFDYSKDRLYKENTYWKCVDRNCQGRVTTKNCQVIRETEHNLHGPNQPDLAVKMSMARIKDAAASSLEPPSWDRIQSKLLTIEMSCYCIIKINLVI